MSDKIIKVSVEEEYIKAASRVLGARGSHNDVFLELSFSPLWEGTTKRVTWFDALGQNPVETLLTTPLLKPGETNVYLVPVPPEAKAESGEMQLTIRGTVLKGDGVLEKKAVVGASVTFTVLSAKFASGAGAPADVTAAQAVQLQAEIDTIKVDIVDARGGAAASKEAIAAAKAARLSQTAAESSSAAAKASETAASSSKTAAQNSAAAALSSQNIAVVSESNAKNSSNLAYDSAYAASNSESAARDSTYRAENAMRNTENMYFNFQSVANERIAELNTNAADKTKLISSEGTRQVNLVTAEGTKQTAAAKLEADKAAADAAKTAADAAKTAADAAKVAADRLVVERAAGAEAGRVTAETAREAGESARSTAENQRVAQNAAESLCEPYDPLQDYVIGNKVVQSGSTYRCLASCRGIAPPESSKWLLIAAKGADGTGKGDMMANLYDPTGRKTDIFAFAAADIDCGTF